MIKAKRFDKIFLRRRPLIIKTAIDNTPVAKKANKIKPFFIGKNRGISFLITAVINGACAA